MYKFHKLPYEYRPITLRSEIPQDDGHDSIVQGDPTQASAQATAKVQVQPIKIEPQSSTFHRPCTSTCVSSHFCRGLSFSKPQSLCRSTSQVIFPPYNFLNPAFLGAGVMPVTQRLPVTQQLPVPQRQSVPTKVIKSGIS